MTVLIDHFPVNQVTGTTDYGPANIADGAVRYQIRLARCTMASPSIWANTSTSISFKGLCSLDGGSTWIDCGSATAVGGIVKDRSGADAIETTFGAPFPSGTNRKIKATVVVVNGPLSSNLTVEVF